MDMNLAPRVGTFFILMGIGLMMVFITYEIGGVAHFDYFLISLILLFIGFRLRANNKPASQDSRFSSVRSISEKFKQKQSQESDKKK
jgi:hypothetical protein